MTTSTASELLSALKGLVESYGYVDYLSDEEKEQQPEVIAARAAISNANGCAISAGESGPVQPLGSASVELITNGLAGIIRAYPEKADHARQLLKGIHAGTLKLTVVQGT